MKKWAGVFSRILSLLMLLALMTHAGALDLSLARQAGLDSPEEWVPWLPDVADPSSEASVKHEGDALVFLVPDQTRQMSWRHSLRPVWLDFHRYLTVEYSAVGFSSEKVVPLIKVHTNPDSLRTVLNSGQIQADGGLHVQTIDLGSLASYAQIIGVIVHIEAHAETTATLVLKRLDFTDQPPGYVFPDVTPLPPAPVGFDLDISRTDTWRARPEWLGPSNISLDYSLESSAHSLIFRINDASRGMKWSHAAFAPIDTGKYNHVLMRYRCREIRPSGTDYALFLSGTGGEARPFYQESLLADGVWHDIAAPLGIPSVNQMAAQVQSNASGGAFLEIEYIRFTEGDPRIDLSCYTTLEAGWDGLTSGTAPFLTMNLEPYFNAEISQLLPRMSLNVPWFSTEEIHVGDLIPFRIKK
ncbi:MAG TPA: hypothetical protein PLB62_14475, partial [Candidatus Sumerlaeota bacterium]|nr:hypothetical protein [Candidatus Sumerlaeota bacterium]